MPKFDDIKKKRGFDAEKYENFDPTDPNSFTEPSYRVPNIPYGKIADGGRNIARKIRRQKINFGLNFSWRALFTLIFVLSVSTFILARAVAAKNDADKLTQEARLHLNQSFSLIESGDISEAMKEADQAKENISKIKLLAQSWGQDIAYLRMASASSSKFVASERLLDASYIIINTITSVNDQLSKMTFSNNEKSTDQNGSIFFNISGNQKVLLAAIQEGENKLNSGKAELLAAKKGLDQAQNAEVDNAISAVDNALQKIADSKDILEKDLTWLSGVDGQEKNILILFQNNGELRGASGGSLGSFGIAKFKDGNLTGVDFGTNIYKIDHAFLAQQKLPVPDQLNWIVPDGLAMKDSGFDIDGPAAMEKIMWFYEQETGKQVDGTIMVDSSAVISLLKEIGPIEVPEMNKTINSDNFTQEVEYEVHVGYFDSAGKAENEPKKILALMMPKFMDKLFNNLRDEKTAPLIFSSLSKSLKQKDIILYFNNTEFENRLKKLNYSAAINSGMGDYFYITNSNIDGAKSSQHVQETVKLNASISDSGNVKNSLELTRKHNGTSDWPDGMNKNFIRLALPENANVENFNPIEGYFEQFFDRGLKDGKPFWTTTEYNRKIVNFWMTTKPQEESKAQIDYSSDYSVNTSGDFYYSITMQKQTGAPADDIELTVNYPGGFAPENVKNYDNDKNQILLKFKLDQDKTIKIRFKKI